MSSVPLPVARPLAVLPRVRRRILLRPDTVAERVCAKWGVEFEAVRGPTRGGQVGAARRDLARQLRACTAMTLAEVGKYVGRDHTTVLYYLKETR